MSLLIALMVAGCTPSRRPPSTPSPALSPPPPATMRALVPTFTPRPMPRPSPTATPAPSERLRAAEAFRRVGDFDAAVAEYAAILADPDAADATEALFRLGDTQYRAGQNLLAAETLRQFVDQHAGSRWVPFARFLLGEIARTAGTWDEAIQHFETYDATSDAIAPYVAERLAEAYEALGQDNEAIEQYRRIVLDPGVDRVWRTLTAEQIATAYFEAHQYDQALAWYDIVLADARIGYYRAEMEYQAGLALEGLGRDEEAWQRFATVVVQYPATTHAASALEQLQVVRYRVNPYQQGLVQFYNSQYPQAITLFRRYLETPEAAYAPQAQFYIALAYDRQGDVEAAIRELDSLRRDFPQSDKAAQAQLEKARTYADAGQTGEALAAYGALARDRPDDPLAPKGLWQGAELFAQIGQNTDAAAAYEALAAQYPGDDGADDALDRAALLRYRAGALGAAQRNWLGLATAYPRSDLRAKALYWAGKIAAADGDAPRAESLWREAARANPEGFYGQRVADRLANRQLAAIPQPLRGVEPSAVEWQALEAWLASWATEPITATALDAVPGLLAESIKGELAFRRGETLLALGLRTEASDEFHRLLDAHANNVWALYALAHFFRDVGLPSLAISAAEQIAHLSPANAMSEAPVALQRLVYPIPFADLLVSEAGTWEIDPLLLASLIWQESRWEPSATSAAQAIGLAQVIPDTGRWIALQLRRSDFAPDDLYRPIVGLEFGAYYLARQLDAFDGDLLRALAAYNAGPGNVQRWDDPDTDLFMENIALEETRLYLERIYAHYRAYEAAYRRG